jgi:hypothetical protein
VCIYTNKDYNDDIRQEQMREMQLLNVSPGTEKVVLAQDCTSTPDQLTKQNGVMHAAELVSSPSNELMLAAEDQLQQQANADIAERLSAGQAFPWIAHHHGRLIPQSALAAHVQGQTQAAPAAAIHGHACAAEQHPALRGLSAKHRDGLLIEQGTFEDQIHVV